MSSSNQEGPSHKRMCEMGTPSSVKLNSINKQSYCFSEEHGQLLGEFKTKKKLSTVYIQK